MIRFACPACNASLKVPDNTVGKKGPCPMCGASVFVPPPVRRAADSPAAIVPEARLSAVAGAESDDELLGSECPTDEYAPPRMQRGTKLGLVALGIVGACILLAITFAFRKPTFADELRAAARRMEEEGLAIDDRTLANHPFWRKPVSVSKIHAILNRMQEKGRGMDSLMVDDEGRMADDGSPSQREKLGDRYILLSWMAGISAGSARKGLLSSMDSKVDEEGYRRRHPR